METTVVFEEKVALEPKDLNKAAESPLDTIILDKLRNKLEGRCSSSGWVIPGSLKMISRSMCQHMAGQFTGGMISWVQVEGKVIYPTDGIVVRGMITKKNKMGLFVDYKNAIQIMVPRDLHLGDEGFDGLRIGDEVDVAIKKSKYQINDEYILSVGVYRGGSDAASEAVDGAEPVVVSEEQLAVEPVAELSGSETQLAEGPTAEEEIVIEEPVEELVESDEEPIIETEEAI